MRVLLTKLPPLLKDILSEAMAGEPDIAMIGGAPSADIPTLVGKLSPDVVLTQSFRYEAEQLVETLRSGGHSVGVVAIDPDARHAFVFTRGEAPAVLADVSPTVIIAAIRSL
jgi:hypothetical protein